MRKFLYLIALLPPDKIAEEVKALKKEMWKQYNSSHTLKSPAHITLQKPFSRTENFETLLINYIENLAARFSPFNIEFSGFGHFDNRVLFISVMENKILNTLFVKLQEGLKNELSFPGNDAREKFTPHMTLAHKDLKPEMFNKAWQEFKDRPFSSTFEAENICLLKHNDKIWESYKFFNFKK